MVSLLGLQKGVCDKHFQMHFLRCLFCSSKFNTSLKYIASSSRYSTISNSSKFEIGIGVPTKIYCARNQIRLASTIASIEEKYSTEELDKVLKTVNDTNNAEDFKKFMLSKKKIDDLVKKKVTAGVLKSIDDVIAVVGVKSYNRFFCSILDRPSQNISNPIFPIPSLELVENSSSVLSVSLTAGKVSWCLIRRNLDNCTFVVESIAQKEFVYKSKMHFLTMLAEISKIAGQVPKSQLCIIEEYPNTMPTPYMFSFQLHMTQMRSTFLGSLSSRPEPPKFISIKTIAVARLFKTYIGSEKVSGQHLVDNIITLQPLPSLSIPDVTKENYMSAESIVKEGMSNVFLLNLAYWTFTKQFFDKW